MTWDEEVGSEADAAVAAQRNELRGRLRMAGRRHLDLADELVTQAAIGDLAVEATTDAFIRVVEEWPEGEADVLGVWHYRAREECYRIEERAAAGREDAAGLLAGPVAEREWEALGQAESESRGAAGRIVEAAAAPGGVLRTSIGGLEDPADIAASRIAVATMLAQLTTRERRVVLLRAAGMTLEEVGDELHRSRSYVVKVIREARRRLSELGSGVAGGLGAWWQRRALGRWRLRRAAGAGGRATANAALTPLGQIAGVVLVVVTSGVFSTSQVADAWRQDGGGPSVMVTSEHPLSVQPARVASEAARRGAVAPVTPPGGATPAAVWKPPPLPVVGARSETPQDTQLVAAAPSPDYSSSHIIVALGFGKTCQCPVLYRTEDGGATWEARGAAPGAEQVVLSADFPHDGRIFLGTNPASGIPPYVVDTFEAVPRPLAAPAGHLALSRGFGSGDDRVLVAGLEAVVAVDVGDGRETVELGYGGAAGAALVATAPAGSGAAAYAWVPSSRVGPAAGGLYECAEGPLGGCSLINADLPADVNELAGGVAAEGPVLVARWDGGLWHSVDGGHRFTAVPAAPAGGAVVGTSLVGGRVWSVIDGAGTSAYWLETYDLGTGGWRSGGRTPSSGSAGDVVVALGGTTILDLLASGLLCSGDGGITWAAHCPVRG